MDSNKAVTMEELSERRKVGLISAAMWHILKIGLLSMEIDGEMAFTMEVAFGENEKCDRETLRAIDSEKIVKCTELLHQISAHVASLQVIIRNQEF